MDPANKPIPTLEDKLIPELWDQIRERIYNKGGYLDFLCSLLGTPRESNRILDVCAGTGEPGLDLLGRGYRMNFVDDHTHMRDRFVSKVQDRGGTVEPGGDTESVLVTNIGSSNSRYFRLGAAYVSAPGPFEEHMHSLSRFPGYSAVMILGDSLPYLENKWSFARWDTRIDRQSSLHSLSDVLRAMYRVLKCRGTLIIEHHQQEEFKKMWHGFWTVVVGGKEYVVSNRFAHEPGFKEWNEPVVRTWTIKGDNPKNGKTAWKAVMRGYPYSPQELEILGLAAGFEKIEFIEQVPGSPYSMFVFKS